MEDAKQLWLAWQHNLEAFQPGFTWRGWVRFSQWTSATVLCDEEHMITREALSSGLVEQWRNWEYLAEYGAWDQQGLERLLMRQVEQEHPCRLGRYRPAAVDDTKAMRASRHVWGVCTFKHQSRNAKQPKLLAAHNWVIMGELCPGDGKSPWTYLPQASRLYFRKTQLPAGETFCTKNELAVAMLRELSEVSSAPVLAIFDGGFARSSTVRPCLSGMPGAGASTGLQIQILTRPRSDARLYRPLVPKAKKPRRGQRKGGRPRKWGKRLAAPRDHRRWNVPWHSGKAWAYGKLRTFRCKQVDCRWSVSGPDVPVRAFVFEVEGYDKPWFIITSALDLTAQQVLEAYAARFRQEDGIRDHKQRLGMEQVRAWTKQPVLRTFQVQLLAMTLLRLLQVHLDRTAPGWCVPPPWNPRKTRVSILDLRRLLWRHRTEFSQFMRQLEELQKPGSVAA
jgi:hypothetical protein